MNTQLLYRYACLDADAAGIGRPVMSGVAEGDVARYLARFMAGSGRYLPGDLNYDNQKRNLAIRLFLDYPMEVLRQHGVAWLDRWRAKYGSAPWFMEWDRILQAASDDDLAHILLSGDEEPTRQRSSMPFSGLLAPDVVLLIKRGGVPV